MILAAGLGTRLKPWTDHHPKALAPVNGKSLLEINIKNLQRFGIFDIIVNVHHFADQIINTLKENNGFGSTFTISDETFSVLETGGGIKNAIPYFEGEGDILVCNADILSSIDIDEMISYHNYHQAAVTLAVQDRASSRKLLFDHKHQLKGWINTQTEKTRPPILATSALRAKAFSGIQIINHTFYNNISLEGKFSIIDAYLDMLDNYKLIAFDHSEDILLDVGKPEALAAAQKLFL